MIKSCFAALTVFFVGAAGLFAAPRDGYHGRRPEPRHNPQMGGEVGGPRGERDREVSAPRGQLLLGTVKSVDTENALIVVTDADGNDKNVRVNPLTRISFIFPPPPQSQQQTQPPAPEGEGSADQGKFCPPQGGSGLGMPPAPPPMVRLEDIKEGTFVVVMKFDTDTQTIEAAQIKIVPPEPAEPKAEEKPQEAETNNEGGN